MAEKVQRAGKAQTVEKARKVGKAQIAEKAQMEKAQTVKCLTLSGYWRSLGLGRTDAFKQLLLLMTLLQLRLLLLMVLLQMLLLLVLFFFLSWS